jgi:hypothetical protein
MRFLLIAGCALALTACEVVESERPLFSGGGPAPAEGLWALLAENCSAPQTTAVHRWPSCATPFWVEGDQLITLSPAPQRMTFVVAPGSPAILQVATPDPPQEPAGAGYTYAGFRPRGASPFKAADVWAGACVKGEMPAAGFRPDSCTAIRPDAVRNALAGASAQEPQAQAVWVAPS